MRWSTTYMQSIDMLWHATCCFFITSSYKHLPIYIYFLLGSWLLSHSRLTFVNSSDRTSSQVPYVFWGTLFVQYIINEEKVGLFASSLFTHGIVEKLKGGMMTLRIASLLIFQRNLEMVRSNTSARSPSAKSTKTTATAAYKCLKLFLFVPQTKRKN